MASESQTKTLQLVSGIPTMVSVSYRHEQDAGSTSWVITHSLGKQYCNVQVIDGTDNEIIPDDISFDSSSQLTITFSQNQTGKAIIII